MNARRVLYCCAICLLPYATCMGVQPATGDPGRFKFARDPQIYVFGPGNAGDAVFRKELPKNAPVLRYNEETDTNAQLLELYAPGYDFSPTAQDAESSRPAGYWSRGESATARAAHFGDVTDCRVTTALAEQLDTHKISWQTFAARLYKALQPPEACLVSIDLPDTFDILAIHHALRSSMPGVPVGLVCRSGSQLSKAAGFDFVICSESALPSPYRSQAAVSYVRSKAGYKPIFFDSVRPQIYKELFWIASGAAGVQYSNGLPALSHEDHKTGWRNIRALSSITSRFTGNTRLAPELLQRGVFGAVVSADSSAYLLLRDADFDVQLPAPRDAAPEFVGTWYNPVTDENIILPRAKRPAGGRLHLHTPSSDPWMYFHQAVPASTDQDSTTTLILPEPPEPPEPDEPAETTSSAISQSL